MKEYNSTIDRLSAKGEVRTEIDIEKLNAEREKLIIAVRKTKKELIALQSKFSRDIQKERI
jgi:hypothetical protein